MASNLGKVYVELSLDDKTYKQKLSDTLTSTQTTARGIETSWKALGTKSDAVFDSQRRAAENAYTLIKNSATSTAQDIIRAEEAKNAKIAALNQQQHGAHVSLTDKLKSNWVAYSAAAIAAWATINKALSWAEIGAKVDQVKESFGNAAKAYGVSADEIVRKSSEAAAGTVGSGMIMQKAMRALTQDIDAQKIPDLFEAARVGARVMGVDVSEAADMVIDATANNMPRALRQMGLVSKEEMKVFNAAINAGVDEVQLLDFVMASAKIKTAELGVAQITAAEQFQQFHVRVAGTQKTLGEYALHTLRGVYAAFHLVAGAVMYTTGAFVTLAGYMSNSDSMKALGADLRGAAGAVKDSALAMYDTATKTGKQYTASEIAELKQRKAAMLDDIRDRTAAAKAASKSGGQQQSTDYYSALTKQNKEYYDSATKSADAWAAKQRSEYAYEGDVIQGFYQKRETALDTWYDKQWDIIEKNVADEKKKNEMLETLNLEYGRKQETDRTNQLVAHTNFIKKKMEAEYSSYSAIQGYAYQAYEVKLDLLEEEAKRIYAATGDEALAYKWLQEQKTIAFIAYAEKEGTAAEGWKAGLLKIQRDTTSWGKAMVKLSDSIYTNMSKGFSDIFYDSVTGDFKGLEEYAKSFGKSVLRSFTDMIGQVAAQKVTAFFTTEWASQGTSVIGTLAKILGYAGEALDDLDLGQYVGVDFYHGGRVNYDDGGAVAGRARYPGDHPGNDTVPAWLSPGEVVVRRSSVNPQTEKILDYINRYGMIPADMYYAGGPVAGMVTNQPGRGYWGFDSFLSILTGGISDIFQGNTWGAATVEGIQQAVEDTFGANTFASQVLTSMLMPAEAANVDIRDILQGEGSFTEKFAAVFERMADPTNSVNYSLERFGAYLPSDGARQAAATLATLIGTIVGGYGGPAGMVAGAALGSGIGAHLKGMSSDEAMRGAGTSAVATYVSSVVADYVSNGIYDTLAYDYGMTFTDAQIKAMNVAGKIAGGLTAGLTRMGIGAVESGFLADKILGSKFKVRAQWGNADWLFNLLSDLGGTVGHTEAYSAKSGLDYVPRDNFLVNTHKGEKILNKEEAEEYRSGKTGASIGKIQIFLDGQEIGGRMKIIADGVVVERNNRGVNSTTRVYQ